jgi:hypothetical protein
LASIVFAEAFGVSSANFSDMWEIFGNSCKNLQI